VDGCGNRTCWVWGLSFLSSFFSRFFIDDTEMESEDELEDCERKQRSVNVYGRGVKHEGRRMDMVSRRIQV
jgi:hypothetical protein